MTESSLVTQHPRRRQVLFTVRTGGLTAAARRLTTRAAAWSERVDPADQEEGPLL
jgi:hypothetical protein